MPAKPINRRDLIGTTLLGAVGISLIPKSSQAMAAKLLPTDPQAAKVGYVEDAGKADVKHFPNYKAGETCANCMLIQLRYGFYRPCKLFPNNVVSAKGWCSAWVPTTVSR